MTTRVSVPHQVIATKGAAARKRALKRALAATGQRRIRDEDWYPEVEQLRDEEWPNAVIASALDLSIRRIQQIRSEGREQWNYGLAQPKPEEEVEVKYHEMLPFTPAAYRLFFDEFSGMKMSEMHYEMVQQSMDPDSDSVMINLPPGHAKTTVMVVWYATWLIATNRDMRIIVLSDSNDLASRIVRSVASNLEFDTDLITAFGRFAPERVKTAGGRNDAWRPGQGFITVLGRKKQHKGFQPTFQARGRTQTILGSRADFIICDDVTNAQVSASDTERDKLSRTLHADVFSRRDPGGRILVVGQRVHLRDVYGELEDEQVEMGPRRGQRQWSVYKHPAILDWGNDNVPPRTLWPAYISWEYLQKQYNSMGRSIFECMYQQNPLPEGERFVLAEWWDRCKDMTRPGGAGFRQPEQFLPVARVVSVDPSPTQWNAMVVADVVSLPEGAYTIAVIEVQRWKGGGERELEDRLLEVYQRLGPEHCIVEYSASTGYMRENPITPRLQRIYNLISHNTNKNKTDATWGLQSLAGDVEAARIRLPYGDEVGRQMSKALEEEFNLYGHGYPDDSLMALWFIKWNLRRLTPRGAMLDYARPGSNPNAYAYIKRAAARRSKTMTVQDWRTRNG